MCSVRRVATYAIRVLICKTDICNQRPISLLREFSLDGIWSCPLKELQAYHRSIVDPFLEVLCAFTSLELVSPEYPPGTADGNNDGGIVMGVFSTYINSVAVSIWGTVA